MEDLYLGAEWFLEHPKILWMQETAIGNQRYHKLVLIVYLHLIEVNHWFDVNIEPLQNVDCFILTGYRTVKKEVKEVVFPVWVSDHAHLDNLDDVLGESINGGHNGSKSLTLAVVESDSKIIFINYSTGLVAPPEPSPDAAPKPIPKWSTRANKWKREWTK